MKFNKQKIKKYINHKKNHKKNSPNLALKKYINKIIKHTQIIQIQIFK